MNLALIHHPDCELHLTGEGHPERPERVAVIQKSLADLAALVYLSQPIKRELLHLAHDKHYVDSIFAIAPREGSIALDEDTIMSPGTLNAALLAAGGVVMAVDLVMQDKAKVAFCNLRPPGHHAEHNKAMGFCFFNNVAIGALYAMQKYGIKKIAIIDFDVHHGNGTQDIFQDNENVLLCSSFEFPQYPGYNPQNDNEHILNLPLPTGTQGAAYRAAVTENWLKQIDAFAPELIFFSAGFDAHVLDPLAGLQLENEDYVWITNEIRQIAEKHSHGRMISVLEGGYNLSALSTCVRAHVRALGS